MQKLPFLLLGLVLLVGCRSQSIDETRQSATDTQKATQERATTSYGSFSPTTLYALLAAEVAGQRKLPGVALRTYMEQARSTQDPGVAERALQIAEYLHAQEDALEAALIWAKTAVDEREAQRSAAIHLALSGRYKEASHYMERALAQQEQEQNFDFLDLNNLDTDSKSRADLLKSLDILLEKHPSNQQLLLSKALLLSQNGESAQVLQWLETQNSKTFDSASILLHSFLLQNVKRHDEALALLSKALKKIPADNRLRLSRARLLLEQNRLSEARADFIRLLQQSPDDDTLRYTLAQIYLEQQAWQEAIVHLNELLERENYLDAAHFALGRAFTALGDSEQAISHYEQIEEGDYYLAALLQRADILFEQGRAAQARQQLAELRKNQGQHRPQLYQIEIELLTKHGQYPQASRIAGQALGEFPDSAELLYARAMLAEKQDDLTQLERDLRKIIEQDPNNSMALNALGYTLVDRTKRLAEGKSLIEQALILAPDDPAILDSLGWAHYRMGRLDQAEPLLRQAMEQYPDAEIAAHLGEVLWQLGKRREARKIWRQAQNEAENHSILQSTIQRLTGKIKP